MPGSLLPRSCTFESGGLEIHYLDWGSEGKPGLLFIHGFGDHAHCWDHTAPKFRDDYHVIAMDMRGHGDSGHVNGGGYDQLDYIVDIANLLEQLQWKTVTLVAHSLGGFHASIFAGTFPELLERLVLVEGWGAPQRKEHLADRMRGWVEQRQRRQSRPPREFKSVDALVARLRERYQLPSDEWVRKMAIDGSKQLQGGNYIWKRDGQRRVQQRGFFLNHDDVFPFWERITCPVLHIRGDSTDWEPPDLDERLTHFANAQLVTVENSGHMVQHDNPEGLEKELRDFLLADQGA